MREALGCHTFILYGSRARGDASADSDYDLIGIRQVGPRLRVERKFEAHCVDLRVYNAASARSPDPSMLVALDGRILEQRGHCGTRFMQRLAALHSRGPKRLPDEELQARRLWVAKMLPRARGADAMQRYWRAKLLTDLLENYFHLRGLWWLGAKKSMAWLQAHQHEASDAFEQAMCPDSSHDDLVRLADIVCAP